MGQLQDVSLESPPVARYHLCPGLSHPGGKISAPDPQLQVPVSVDLESVMYRIGSSLQNVPALFRRLECARQSQAFEWHRGD